MFQSVSKKSKHEQKRKKSLTYDSTTVQFDSTTFFKITSTWKIEHASNKVPSFFEITSNN